MVGRWLSGPEEDLEP